MRHCVEHLDLAPNSNYADPPVGNDPMAVDGHKAIAFELWEQLGHRTPALITMPVDYGDALFAVHKAFDELHTIASTPRPRLLAAEVYGSLHAALATDADTVSPAAHHPGTVAPSIGTRRAPTRRCMRCAPAEAMQSRSTTAPSSPRGRGY